MFTTSAARQDCGRRYIERISVDFQNLRHGAGCQAIGRPRQRLICRWQVNQLIGKPECIWVVEAEQGTARSSRA